MSILNQRAAVYELSIRLLGAYVVSCRVAGSPLEKLAIEDEVCIFAARGRVWEVGRASHTHWTGWRKKRRSGGAVVHEAKLITVSCTGRKRVILAAVRNCMRLHMGVKLSICAQLITQQQPHSTTTREPSRRSSTACARLRSRRTRAMRRRAPRPCWRTPRTPTRRWRAYGPMATRSSKAPGSRSAGSRARGTDGRRPAPGVWGSTAVRDGLTRSTAATAAAPRLRRHSMDERGGTLRATAGPRRRSRALARRLATRLLTRLACPAASCGPGAARPGRADARRPRLRDATDTERRRRGAVVDVPAPRRRRLAGARADWRRAGLATTPRGGLGRARTRTCRSSGFLLGAPRWPLGVHLRAGSLLFGAAFCSNA